MQAGIKGFSNVGRVIPGITRFTENEIYLFKEGTHYRLDDFMGSHPMCVDGKTGIYFATWAPNARTVSVIGDFNNWNRESHRLYPRWDESGIWEGFIPGIEHGTVYKYHIVSKLENYRVDKGDPYCYYWESPPKTASKVWELSYEWGDVVWMENRKKSNSLSSPFSIYELHLGSWSRRPEEGGRFLTYRELAPYLAEYVSDLGFTHVELLPVMEHPFYGSWGYQTLGFFAPSSRFGTPEDFMYLIDHLHQHGIGVILDWVPSHFPGDEFGLIYFDGTHLYEHRDPKKGVHPDWDSYIFNYGRNEVRGFLISSAFFWLDKYHIDGLRVDGVASMIYLDYGRREGEWIPNEYGGKENLEAIEFLKRFNEAVYINFPGVQTIAEESTAWPMVSRPAYVGGLGFGMKWNMGWMHDTLDYFSKDPIRRKFHHNQLTFSIWYAFYENFILSLSHDEVVYGKGSLLRRMPGDDWQKVANLRALFGYMFGHPGKKLIFMGGEFGQWDEWYHEKSLDWHLLEYPSHRGILRWVKDLNHFYKNEPSLFELDFSFDGFEWVEFRDSDSSVISFIRKGNTSNNLILVICNFTPVPRINYRIGAPRGGYWMEVLNSDSTYYGGSGIGNSGGVEASSIPEHGRQFSLSISLPPFGVLFFKN